MSYLTQSQANRPLAIAAVIFVHSGLAALVLAGFAAADIVRVPQPRIIGVDIKGQPPPDPEPVAEPIKEAAAIARPVNAPLAPIDLGPASQIRPQPQIADIVPIALPPLNLETGIIAPGIPSAAIALNDPGSWVTDADYKTRWINEDRQGTASFRLEVSAQGRVNSCTITRSTGHAALDRATCELITRRARFRSAGERSGPAIGTSYEGSIRWQLPG